MDENNQILCFVSSSSSFKLFTHFYILLQMLCAICGVLSLIFANGAGSYIFQLMDSFAGNYTLLIIAFCEVRHGKFSILRKKFDKFLFSFLVLHFTAHSVYQLVMSMD